MKRFLFTACFVLFAIITFGQSKSDNTLKFLGFPVDGSKEAMIKNLKTKGFTYHTYEDFDYLKGDFNGQSCSVLIHTNNGKVDRIMVSDYGETSSESNIRITYNILLAQFERNSKYVVLLDPNLPIPEGEDIGYKISVEKKRYQASFDFVPNIDSDEINEAIYNRFYSIYPKESIKSFSEEEKKNAEYTLDMIKRVELGKRATGDVWFMISYNAGKYSITIYYDNLNNRPDGEDL